MSLLEPPADTSAGPPPPELPDGGIWAGVVGQDEARRTLDAALERLVPSYVFVGPRGSGKRAAALAFAAEVLSRHVDPGRADVVAALALLDRHPDLVVVEPEGRSFRRDEAAMLMAAAFRSPTEAARKVVVADLLHTAEPEAAASLLKTVEEPPASAVFVLIAEEITPELVTLASRSVSVSFGPVAPSAVHAHLLGMGVGDDVAEQAAAACGGDLRRAEVLAIDDQLAERWELWRSVPSRLDGRGAVVAALVKELGEALDAAAAPLEERLAAEMAELAALEEERGTRGSGRARIEAAHKRERRRVRTDEIHFGLTAVAGRYRELLVAETDVDAALASLDAITQTAEDMVFNPNETLLLQALLLGLRPIQG